MATFSQLPSGKWRAQVRRAGVYRGKSFDSKAAAKKWAAEVERQTESMSLDGFLPIPKSATVADLIDKYGETIKKEHGRHKTATLAMLRREIGKTKLAALSAVVLRDFIDKRIEQGAGGSTIAADLSFLSTVLKWGRNSRRLDLPVRLARDARESLAHRGLATRSKERTREPTDDELQRLYDLWASRPRQQIDMPTICRFALATAMRQEEICKLMIEDVDRDQRTVIIRDRKDPKLKLGNHQTVPLLPTAWSIVEPIIRDREFGKIFNAHGASVSATFTRACTALGIEDLRFHDLRHRATTDLFRMGLDIPRVSLLTGHRNWSMLRRYTKINAADVHARIKEIGGESHAT